MTTYNFSRDQYGAVTASADTKRTIGEEFARSPGVMPAAIVRAASDDLVAEAKKLMFSTGYDYETCANRAMELDPWLRIATAAIAPDGAAMGMGIMIAEAAHA